MKRIVPWQIILISAAVGVRAFMVMGGGIERTLVIVAAAAFVGFAVVATFAFVGFGTTFLMDVGVGAIAGFAYIANFHSGGSIGIPAFPLIGILICTGGAAGLVAVFALLVSYDLDVPKQWTLTAYGVEAGTIFGVLAAVSVGWIVVIGAIGILALLAAWKFGPITLSTDEVFTRLRRLSRLRQRSKQCE